MDTKQKLLERLGFLQVVSKGEKLSRLGEVLPFYVDIKKSFGDPEALRLLAEALSLKVPQETTVLAAMGHGGLPLVTSLSLAMGIPLCSVRTGTREHGTGSPYDGHVPTALDKVFIVDDVFTTGSSIRETLEKLKTTKARVLGAAVVVKRGEGDIGIPLSYVFEVSELL